MLFSPCHALIRKLLLDTVWFVLELMVTSLNGELRLYPFDKTTKQKLADLVE
jgi:hypothetical protein